jgi:haloacetate dehalogenase
MMERFSARKIDVADATIFGRSGGSGPPLLLLHGFPETHLMWREVAEALSGTFTIVCADLRGYGASTGPASSPDHAAYAKRAMARDMIAVMEQLGFRKFSVAGHDRGARVAYRLALDHPERVERIAVLDIVPTAIAWEMANADFALGFWPWSLLAQDAPLPERILQASAEAIVDAALDGWGSPANVFPGEVRAAYAAALREPAHAAAICEEYRAAASIDREHDRQDIEAGRKIACPTLVLWAENGPVDQWYRGVGGPLAIWRGYAGRVEGEAVPGGHFFPEVHPRETANRLARFFTSRRHRSGAPAPARDRSLPGNAG